MAAVVVVVGVAVAVAVAVVVVVGVGVVVVVGVGVVVVVGVAVAVAVAVAVGVVVAVAVAVRGLSPAPAGGFERTSDNVISGPGHGRPEMTLVLAPYVARIEDVGLVPTQSPPLKSPVIVLRGGDFFALDRLP